jgi:hypothetical protein
MPNQYNSLRFNREGARSSITETIYEGSYVADLFVNEKVQPPIFHYIITQKGSSEILDWGQGFSMDAMREQAENWLAHSAQRIAS